MMAYNVYNQKIQRLSLIDNFMHAEWTENYNDLGNLVLVVPETPHNISVLQAGNYITRVGRRVAMIITGVEYSENRTLIVYGTSALKLLSRRIVTTTLMINDAEESIRSAVNTFKPTPIIAVNPSKNLGIKVDNPYETTYSDVFETCKKICEMTNIGMRMLLDTQNKKLNFDVYVGSPKTNAIYSDFWGNMLGSTLTKSDVQYKNVAIVAGQGLNEERVSVLVGDVNTKDEERFEMYVDARDLQQEAGETIEAYKNRLIARGFEKLQENRRIFDLVVDIPSEDFGKKFNIGDTIKCNIERYNIKVDILVQGYTIKQVNNLESISLNLGTPIIRR